MNLHHQIALSIAKELNFECFSQGQNHGASVYRFVLSGDCPYLHEFRSPMAPGDFNHNPCGELPNYYTVYVRIKDSTLTLNDRLDYDLNDPDLMDKLRKKFSDLRALQEELDGVHDPKGAIGEPGFYASPRQRALVKRARRT